MTTTVLRRQVHPGILGIANVAASGVLGIVWAWLPLSLFFGGIGLLTAFGLGIFLLIPWFYIQRCANWVERYRSEAVYGLDLAVPPMRRSDESGFWGFVMNQVYRLFSAAFWRATCVHYLKMALGLTAGLIWGIFTSIGILLCLIAVNRDVLTIFFGADQQTVWATPWLVVMGIAAFVLGLLTLWFAAIPDRAIDQALLGVPRAEVLAEQLSITSRARQGAVDAAANERLRIERDLHDGVQPTLVAVSMKIGMAKARLARDPEGARALIEEAHADSKAAISELRQTVRGIHPAVLEDRGLDAAVSALAARSVIPVSLRTDIGEPLSREVESVTYFVIAEAITNANKHSQATAIGVDARTVPPDPQEPQRTGSLSITVSDNGRGGAVFTHGGGTGLAGLAARAASARGTFSVSSPVGGPTDIHVELPCA